MRWPLLLSSTLNTAKQHSTALIHSTQRNNSPWCSGTDRKHVTCPLKSSVSHFLHLLSTTTIVLCHRGWTRTHYLSSTSQMLGLQVLAPLCPSLFLKGIDTTTHQSQSVKDWYRNPAQTQRPPFSQWVTHKRESIRAVWEATYWHQPTLSTHFPRSLLKSVLLETL